MLDEIRKQQEEQRARIAGTYIQKSESNDIEKGGEGSKGGHVIGHTKSGKPIYDLTGGDHKAYSLNKHGFGDNNAAESYSKKFAETYKDFTPQDHIDAADVHKKLSAEANKKWKEQGKKDIGSGFYKEKPGYEKNWEREGHGNLMNDHSFAAMKKSNPDLFKAEESQLTPQEHQRLIKSQISNTIGGKTLSLDELEKSATDYFEKGGKPALIGEKRTLGGREYVKTAEGWKYHGKGTGAKAQEHIKAALAHHVEAGKTTADKISDHLEDKKWSTAREATASSIDEEALANWKKVAETATGINKEAAENWVKHYSEKLGIKEGDSKESAPKESKKASAADISDVKSAIESLSATYSKGMDRGIMESNKTIAKMKLKRIVGSESAKDAKKWLDSLTSGDTDSKESVATKDSTTPDKNAEIHDLIKKHFPTATYDTKNSWYTVKNPKPGAKAAYQKEMMSKNHHGEGKVTDIFHDASELNIVIKK